MIKFKKNIITIDSIRRDFDHTIKDFDIMFDLASSDTLSHIEMMTYIAVLTNKIMP